MQTDFMPIDYDYFDFEGRNYAKIIGRNSKEKRICIIDSCDVYLWAILEESVKERTIKELVKKIMEIKLDEKGRQTEVEKVEVHEKNFLGKKVRALKIFATNYKDLHDIADRLDLEGIEKRRGYDLGFITHYIIEKKILPMQWYEISGKMMNNSAEFGGIDSSLDVDFCIKLGHAKKIEEKNFAPKVVAFDIETDEIKIGEGEILMISLFSENFKKVITWKKDSKKHDYVEYVKDEKEMLEKFVECVRKFSPDFLVGYFSDGFDMPYIKARAEKLKVKLPLGLDGSQPRIHRGIIPAVK
ncbi:MAG: 3'-5' exonuclease, partial [Nanoarchaeota archaeon]